MIEDLKVSSKLATLKHFIFGVPRNLNDLKIFYKLALVSRLAWIGFGAERLSSSSCRLEEALSGCTLEQLSTMNNEIEIFYLGLTQQLDFARKIAKQKNFSR